MTATTIWVDKANDSGVEEGSEQSPFSTITSALAVAQPDTLVLVNPGVYDENVIINTGQVTIRGNGESAEGVTIAGPAGSVVVALQADGAALDHLLISGGSTGVLLDGATDCRLGSVNIWDISGDSPTGARLVGSSGNSLLKVEIRNVTATNGGEALGCLFDNAGENTLSACLVHGIQSGPADSMGLAAGMKFTGGDTGNEVHATHVWDIHSEGGNDSGNAMGFHLDESSIDNLLDVTTLVSGEPVHYYYGIEGVVVSGDTLDSGVRTTNWGRITLINCDSALVEDTMVAWVDGAACPAWSNATEDCIGGTARAFYFQECAGGVVSGNTAWQVQGGADGWSSAYPKDSVNHGGHAFGFDVVACSGMAFDHNDVSFVQGGRGGQLGSLPFPFAPGGWAAAFRVTGGTGNAFGNNWVDEVRGGDGGSEDYSLGCSLCTSGTGGPAAGFILRGDSTDNELTGNVLTHVAGGAGGPRSNGVGTQAGVDQPRGTGVHLEPDSLANDIALTNTLDSEPIVYLYGKTDVTIAGLELTAEANPTNLGKLVVIDSSNVELSANTVGGFAGTTDVSGMPGVGIHLSGCKYCSISGNQVIGLRGGAGQAGYFGPQMPPPAEGGEAVGILLNEGAWIDVVDNAVTDVTGGKGGRHRPCNGTTGWPQYAGQGAYASAVRIADSEHVVLSGLEVAGITGGAGGETGENCEYAALGETLPLGLSGSVSAVAITDSTDVVVSSSSFSHLGSPGGHETAGEAAGIRIEGTSQVEVNGVVVADVSGGETSDSGTPGVSNGIVVEGTSVVKVANATVYGLGGPAPGAGVEVGAGASATVTNSIFSDFGNGVCVENTAANDPTAATVAYSLFYGCAGGAVVNGTELAGTCIHDQFPFFLDADDNDFHLLNVSPAIDAGDSTDDYAQEPEPNGCRINMGAYGNTEGAAANPGAEHCP